MLTGDLFESAGSSSGCLTGQTMGYEYDAPRYARNDAIEKWVDALESGALADLPTPDPQAMAGEMP